MIRHNYEHQALECTACGDVVEISRRTSREPETLVMMQEQMRVEHAPCDEFADEPTRARAERKYRRLMAEEMRKLA